MVANAYSAVRLFDDSMLKRAILTVRLLFILLASLFRRASPAEVIEQLITVIDGEPYTLSNLETLCQNQNRPRISNRRLESD